MLNQKYLKNKNEVLEFDSLDACIQYGEQPASKDWRNKGSERKSRATGRDEVRFRGTESWKEANEIASLGWKEGRELVDASLAAIFESGASQIESAQVESFGVAGAFPDVPLYLAGEIAHMQLEGEDNQDASQIIKLIIDIGAHCGINKKSIANRGAAVAALVDEIESTGKRCEIWATFGSSVKPKTLYTFVCAKASGEPLDIDKVAFTIGHPSMLRRMMFAVIEACPFTDKSSYEGTYGYPVAPPAESVPNDSIYLRRMEDDKGYRTPTEAMDTIRAIYEKEASTKGLTEVAL